MHPAELQVDEAVEATLKENPSARRNLDILRDWSQRTPQGRPRRLHLRFLLRPIAMSGRTAVTGLELARGRLDGSGHAVDTGERLHLPAQIILRAVGYRGLPLPGLPFDNDRGTIPNSAGRVLRGGAPAPGEYVAGWIKRGPTGVVGTDKHDASETVRCLLEDAALLPPPETRDPDAIMALLHQRGVRVVEWDGWEAIDALEICAGLVRERQAGESSRPQAVAGGRVRCASSGAPLGSARCGPYRRRRRPYLPPPQPSPPHAVARDRPGRVKPVRPVAGPLPGPDRVAAGCRQAGESTERPAARAASRRRLS